MEYSIKQTDDGWIVVGANGEPVGEPHADYHAAIGALRTLISTELAEAGHRVLDRDGVSVDPTEKVDLVENFECVAYDDNGDCVDGELTWQFLTYEIGGFTMEPHPCFEDASIILAGAATVEPLPPAEPIAASATFAVTPSSGLTVIDGNVISITTAPPVEWLRLPEPALGMPFLAEVEAVVMGDDVLVEQLDGNGDVVGLACPLTITDDGQVYGHLTYWGQCHIAEPWGPGVCASATKSAKAYADFHTGHVVCADGTDVPTGVLSVGCEHSSAFDVAGVRDHLAHSGMGWADVHVIDGMYGPWLCGVLKPDLTEAQVRLLRSLSLSGEWVGELAGILAVNTPGLPVQRALAASALPAEMVVAQPALRSSRRNGEVTKLVGGNIVRRCPECEKRRLLGAAFDGTGVSDAFLSRMARNLERVERRTRHLIPAEAAASRKRLST